jgi:D-arabinono-1,4-lactone oxidase
MFEGQKLAKFLCGITAVVVVYGLAAAHVPFLIGNPWSSCAVKNELGCVLSFHLLEVPIVLYQAFFAWYGLSRLQAATVGTFRVLLGGSIILNAMFGLFEASLLLETLKADGPMWEAAALTSLLVLFQAGVFLGLYLYNKIRTA